MAPAQKDSFHSSSKWPDPIGWLVWGLFLAGCGWLLVKSGWPFGLAMIGAFPAGWLLFQTFRKPVFAVLAILATAFLNNGLSRYSSLPWGLMVDVLLVASWLGLLFSWKNQDWKQLRNSFMAWSLGWFVVVFMQLFNPEMIGAEAWFYAMRAAGFYQLLMMGLVFLAMQERRIYPVFIHSLLILSAFGAIWGLKQHYFGLDPFEEKWLAEGPSGRTHLLFGVLRVFSFYSDAGQFGAAQAMVFVISGVLMLGPVSFRKRLFYASVALLSLTGFLNSGTRGALAVVVAGAVAWLFVVRNGRMLLFGLLASGLGFYFLKYTFLFQHIEQVRRLRSALDPNDPSLLVRLANQQIFADYLADKPFGAGIGAVGYWGNRFAPESFLAQMPTDSYFVKIWVETGIVGIAIHLLMLGFFVGRGAVIVRGLCDPLLRQQCAALFAGFCGILLASYGNQVFSQTPSSIVCYVALALVFMAPRFDGAVLKN